MIAKPIAIGKLPAIFMFGPYNFSGIYTRRVLISHYLFSYKAASDLFKVLFVSVGE